MFARTFLPNAASTNLFLPSGCSLAPTLTILRETGAKELERKVASGGERRGS